MGPTFPLGLIAAALLCAGCAGPAVGPRPGREPQGLPAPVPCVAVPVGAALQEVVGQGAEGAAFCLEAGTHLGPVSVPSGVTLWGPAGAVIQSNGHGTTVLLGSRSRLLGVTVDGAGGRFDLLDAAVKAEKADDVHIEGVAIVKANFGILLEQVKRATVRGNHVVGIGGSALGLRGDGIRLWETYDSLVEGNLVEQSRDLVVWYSSRNVLKNNEVRHCRYGTHFMYSHGNRVEGSRYLSNEVGIFVMYSRQLTIEGNTLLGASGAAGMGLGMKESGALTVRNNLVVHNTIGFFLDNSPLNVGDTNLFEDNLVRLGDVGVTFLSSTHDNRFKANAFRDNHLPVKVESGGDALGVQWEGNEFDDYVGYDLDHDGFGDIPYELSDLSNVLESRNADLAFLRGTPALALVSVAGHVVPLFAPKPILKDLHPRLTPREWPHAN